jgi:hypothetical protein
VKKSREEKKNAEGTPMGVNLQLSGLKSSQRENAGLFLQKPPHTPQKLLSNVGTGAWWA